MGLLEKTYSVGDTELDSLNNKNLESNDKHDLFMDSLQATIFTESWKEVGDLSEWVTSSVEDGGINMSIDDFKKKIFKRTKREIIDIDHHLELQKLRNRIGHLLGISTIASRVSREKKIRLYYGMDLYTNYLEGKSEPLNRLYANAVDGDKKTKQKSLDMKATDDKVSDKDVKSINDADSFNKKEQREVANNVEFNEDIANLFFYAEKLKNMFDIKIVYKNK